MVCKATKILDEDILDKGIASWEGWSRVAAPIFFDGGGDMLEVNGLCLFDLGNINQLFMLPEGQRLNANFYKINEIIFHIESFVNAKQNQVNMPDSVEYAKKILINLNLFRKEKVVITAKVKEHFDYLLHNFRTVLSSELGKLTTILLEEKRGHSVQTLWKHQNRLFPDGVYNCLSKFVKSNSTEGAKCLVLNCYTAVGFHAMRSIEHVSRRFYELLKGKPPIKLKGDSMGLGAIAQEFIDLKNKSEDVAIIGSIIKGLTTKKRDPLAHPDIVSLSEGEATETFVDALQIISKVVTDAKAKGSHYVTPWKRGFLF